jgi:hypothetical protein
MDRHYTYYSYEEFGRGYIGVRSCECLPEEDVEYLGSFKDNTFNPTEKIILRDDYKTREAANEDEIILHDFYDVARNPHFSNLCKATSTGFSRAGVQTSDETKQKQREAMIGRYDGEKHPAYGKSRSKEHRQKLSDANSGKNNPMYGRTGKNNPLYGTHAHTKEARQRIREAMTGINNHAFGKKWWVNSDGDTIRQTESPGLDWIQGRKWK